MKPIISDTLLTELLQPSKCQLRVVLSTRGESRAAKDPYDAVLDELTDDLLQSERSKLQPLDLSKGSVDDRVLATKAHVESKSRTLFKPLLQANADVGKTACTLRATPDFLVPIDDKFGHAIRICDASRIVSDKDATAARLRHCGQIYKLLFGKNPKLEIIDGAGNIVEISATSAAAKLRSAQEEALAAIQLTVEPYEPVGKSKCSMCPFYKRCWTKAESAEDVALIKGVDQSLAHQLHAMNIHTTTALHEHFGDDVAKLAAVQRKWGHQMKRVGETDARTILRFARAMKTGKEQLLHALAVPVSEHYVMFDLEGLPEKIDRFGPIYIWGLQVVGAKSEPFNPAVAPFGTAGDAIGWQAFLMRCAEIFTKYGDIPFIHWDKYERVRLDAYVEKHGDNDAGTAARVRANLVDLRKELEDAIVLPITSYSLKVVEKYIRYKRSQDEFGTNWSIKMYVEARDTTDEALRQSTMARLLTYNKEDLEAMWATLLWAQKRSAELETQTAA